MTWRRFVPIFLISCLFVLPWSLAIYFYLAGKKPVAGSAQHGQLLSPAVPLTQWQLTDKTGDKLSLKRLAGKWHLIYIAGGQCGADCQERLYYLRQIHKALGRYRDQLQTEVLVTSHNPGESLYQIVRQYYPSMQYWQANRSKPQNIKYHKPVLETGDIALADPHGRVIIIYAHDTDPEGILKDVERVVKTTLTAVRHEQ